MYLRLRGTPGDRAVAIAQNGRNDAEESGCCASRPIGLGLWRARMPTTPGAQVVEAITAS